LKWSGSHLQKEDISTRLGATFVSSLLCSIINFSCWFLRRGTDFVRWVYILILSLNRGWWN